MRTEYANMDEGLLTFFEPQVEQLSLTVRPVRSGIVAATQGPTCEGGVWAAPVGRFCLLMVNHVRFPQRTAMTERPRACLCAGIATASALTQIDVPQPQHTARPDDNPVVFLRPDAPQDYVMEAGLGYGMHTFTFLPDFFREQAPDGPDFERIAAAAGHADQASLPAEFSRVLRRLDATQADSPCGSMRVHAAALEVAAILVEHATQAQHAHDRRGGRDQRELVARARELVEAHLAQGLSLDELAARLYVGRTHLCEAFHAETGESLGRYVRRRRIERACELLATTDLSLDAIARAVGYRRQGSLSEAFRAATGMTPTAWRTAHR